MSREALHATRLKRLRAGLASSGLKGVVVVPGPNLRYLTGGTSLMLERPFMLLVPLAGEPQLIAPALESGPYVSAPFSLGVHAWTDSEGPGGAIRDATKRAGAEGQWGVEGRAPFQYTDKLAKGGHLKLVSAEPILQKLRESKDNTEVGLLKKSARALSRAFSGFPGLIKEGATELELARAMTDAIYAQGAEKVDDMLVQAGQMAADPHHLPSTRRVNRGESIVVDVGSTYGGYYADVTRTFCVGRSPAVERVYSKVLEAQEAAVAASKAGTEVGEVDAAARGMLESAGMGRYFFHRTGHGLGLEIHEAPYIVDGGKERLGPGMCFTVEPGAYIRGKLGVRIEDDLLIEGGRGVQITDVPKEFGWWS
ncbi:MAG: aminopeptidase P family protein [Nitrososphaerota archaeon]|jgi:Xaa-Pro aminopeptidase|nr:Xaa-Pro peptidase family protein [Nitrososphaerota archaeon]MCL5672064.1 Xaa-Pro peptidase family protein [Nitrososphaerota archaeon]MDG6903657.1 aminopeptidase P family protein [Nitrososphaerota archaeon]MDG6924506.1 aminopeptidase P family protein [Nitrososphaerota archaeon]MDG6941041.1 aminopeptidase P family protein [Nitrososphaerota archaeon]